MLSIPSTNTLFTYSLNWSLLAIITTILLTTLKLIQILYRLTVDPLHNVPGPWYTRSSSLWLVYQRWNGRLSLSADKLLSLYGPIVRISPSLILINDPATVEKIFTRRDLDTAPKAVRALRVGGHDWTVTFPENGIARERRHPVMIATTNKCMKYWNETFDRNIGEMVGELKSAEGGPMDIVLRLRIATLKNSQVLMGGSGVELETENFPHVVGEYNFLVVWRLCLPEWLFTWLGYSPFSHARFRVRSSDKLFKLGEEICKQAEQAKIDRDADGNREEEVPNVYGLFTTPNEKKTFPLWTTWTKDELSAEMAGQILAATETTSSALAFIFYELAKNPLLQEEIFREMQHSDGTDDTDTKDLLDACIKEGLRFRPPVALTGSRLVPEGGLDVLGYFLPAGTVLTTQSLSMSIQRPDLFPNSDVFDPHRWLVADAKLLAERKKLLVPFGVGSRRCPGFNAALWQMRMILRAVIKEFVIGVAEQTTEEVMQPFEANGYRSRYDECFLVFEKREGGRG